MAGKKLIHLTKETKKTVIAQIAIDKEGKIEMVPLVKIKPLNLASLLVGWANALLQQQIRINLKEKGSGIVTPPQINLENLDLKK